MLHLPQPGGPNPCIRRVPTQPPGRSSASRALRERPDQPSLESPDIYPLRFIRDGNPREGESHPEQGGYLVLHLALDSDVASVCMFPSIPFGHEVDIPHFEILDTLFEYPHSSKVLAEDAAILWSGTIRHDVQVIIQKLVLRYPRPEVAVPMGSHTDNALVTRVRIPFTHFEEEVDPVAGKVAPFERICDPWQDTYSLVYRLAEVFDHRQWVGSS